jgi:SAM-dependent methyltransferase
MILESLKKRIFSSKNDSAKKQFMQDLMTDDFMDLMNDINLGKSGDMPKLVELAKNIEHLKDWPDNPETFWDIEAPFWQKRIDDSTKMMISDFIKKNTHGRILNIGSGSVPYIESVNLDISSEMLNWNPSKQKVQADALKLPFRENIFDSVIVAFVANYMRDLDVLISEIMRVIKDESSLVFIQGKSINHLHQLVENKDFSVSYLASLLRDRGFSVRTIEKEKIIFLRCNRQ